MWFLKTSSFLGGLAFLAQTTFVLSQTDGTQILTDSSTGIVFNSWNPSPDVVFGMALPNNALKVDATEFIGYLSCKKSWCGLSFGGGMVDSLLLLAYPSSSSSSSSSSSNNNVLLSLRWASDYVAPQAYTGDAKLTEISSSTNSTHFSITFRCRGCLKWVQKGSEGTAGAAPTSEGFLVLGWCHAGAGAGSSVSGGEVCADGARVRQHDSQGIFGAELNADVIRDGKYDEWVSKWDTGKGVSGQCGAVGGGEGQEGEGEGEGGGVVVTSVVTLAPHKPTTTMATSVVAPPTSTPVPGPGPGACQKSYTVKAGDYCWLIATDNGLTLDQFYAINPGLVCNPLQIGAVVCLARR